VAQEFVFSPTSRPSYPVNRRIHSIASATILSVYLTMASKVFGIESSGYSHRIRPLQTGVSSQVNSRPTSGKNASTPIPTSTLYQSERPLPSVPPSAPLSAPFSAISGITESANEALSLRARGTTEPPAASLNDISCKMISDTILRLRGLANGWDSDCPEIAIPVTVEQFNELLLKVKEDSALNGWFEDKARSFNIYVIFFLS
jgi:hypothetical protein